MKSSSFKPGMVKHFIEAINEATNSNFVPKTYSQVQLAVSDNELDLIATSQTDDGKDVVVIAVCKKTGYPRDIREAALILKDFKDRLADHKIVIPMVIAEHLSPGAKAMLRSENIGYFDTSESMFLKAKHWLVNIDRGEKSPIKRRAAFLFTGAREQVIHALLWQSLGNRCEWFTGMEIADMAGTSQYTVSLTLQELERMEWLESDGIGKKNLRRRLIAPAKLLDAWAESWRLRTETKTRYFVHVPEPNVVLKQIAEKIGKAEAGKWAFTGEAAANLTGALLTSTSTAEIVVPEEQAAQFVDRAGLQRVEKEANVTIVERSGASLMLQNTQHAPYRFASPIIMYLDLLDGQRRRKELAAHLRATILKI